MFAKIIDILRGNMKWIVIGLVGILVLIYGVSYVYGKFGEKLKDEIENVLKPQQTELNKQLEESQKTVEDLKKQVDSSKAQIKQLNQAYNVLRDQQNQIAKKIADIDKQRQTVLTGNANDVQRNQLNEEVRKLINQNRRK